MLVCGDRCCVDVVRAIDCVPFAMRRYMAFMALLLHCATRRVCYVRLCGVLGVCVSDDCAAACGLRSCVSVYELLFRNAMHESMIGLLMRCSCVRIALMRYVLLLTVGVYDAQFSC